MKNRIGPGRALLLLSLAMAACGDGSPTIPEDVDFAGILGIDLSAMTRLPSGVYVQTLEPGSGTAQVAASSTVVLDYTLWLPNGTLVQGPARLNPAVAGSDFITGFSQGLIGLKLGELRRIIVPSELGYGANPREDSGIPKHSVLIFEVRLISMS